MTATAAATKAGYPAHNMRVIGVTGTNGKTGYEFKTDTDSEVIIAGYERYGIDELLSKLRGMFAFTIYDKKKE